MILDQKWQIIIISVLYTGKTFLMNGLASKCSELQADKLF